jgi:23S rRNA (guanosine2251-2'-O)-methyltransferase
MTGIRKLGNDELGRMNIEEFKQSQKFPFVLVLDNIRSMNNIGSMFRTADAFRIEEMLLCGLTACPPHREIQRTALDAAESVAWKYFEKTLEAINYLREKKYLIYAIEQAEPSLSLYKFRPTVNQKIALIMGNEINGVDEQLIPYIEGCIEIPQFGTKHSLNVAVSAGIVLWDVFSKVILADKK